MVEFEEVKPEEERQACVGCKRIVEGEDIIWAFPVADFALLSTGYGDPYCCGCLPEEATERDLKVLQEILREAFKNV